MQHQHHQLNRTILDLGEIFDPVIFGDSDQFDFTNKTYEISDSITTGLNTFRNITGVSITITDSIARLLSATRTITDSVSS